MTNEFENTTNNNDHSSLLLLLARDTTISTTGTTGSTDSNNAHHYSNNEFVRSFGSYPNILNITDNDRKTFHPVLKLPKNRNEYIVSDYHQNYNNSTSTSTAGSTSTDAISNNSISSMNLATEQEREQLMMIRTGTSTTRVTTAIHVGTVLFRRIVRSIRWGIVPRICFLFSTNQNHYQQLLSRFFQKIIYTILKHQDNNYDNNNNNSFDVIYGDNKNKIQLVHYLHLHHSNKINKNDTKNNDTNKTNEATTTTNTPLIPNSHQQQQEKRTTNTSTKNKKQKTKIVYYGVGRYDEDRISMYRSLLFDQTNNSIDGYSGRRTVHIGIDLNGPLGTPVYSFTDGILYDAGYNPQLGDYGYVIVIQYTIPSAVSTISSSSSSTTISSSSISSSTTTSTNSTRAPITFYALYGHLDRRTTEPYRKAIMEWKKYSNTTNATNNNNNNTTTRSTTTSKLHYHIRKGQIIGRLGDIYENGGWKIPHVHFQLSIQPPTTHDMPGAVSRNDRNNNNTTNNALLNYPDPRYILGEIY